MPEKNQRRIPAKRNIQNLTKVTKTTPLLIKTTPESFKTIPKPYYFLTLFDRIYRFLRFCDVASSRQTQRTYATPILLIQSRQIGTKLIIFFTLLLIFRLFNRILPFPLA